VNRENALFEWYIALKIRTLLYSYNFPAIVLQNLKINETEKNKTGEIDILVYLFFNNNQEFPILIECKKRLGNDLNTIEKQITNNVELLKEIGINIKDVLIITLDTKENDIYISNIHIIFTNHMKLENQLLKIIFNFLTQSNQENTEKGKQT
jgi:hypothetical protein